MTRHADGRERPDDPTESAPDPEHPVGSYAGVTEQPPAQTSGAPRGGVLPTGIAGLDRLLRGGLRPGGLYVVRGGPGCGKSILAHQMGARHIREDGGRVLYLTALVESHQTLLAQARTFGFFDPGVVSHSFYYASLFPALEKGGLTELGEEVRRLVREREPTLLVIDGVHALKRVASTLLDYQRWVHGLETLAAVGGVTVLVLVHPEEDASDPTSTIADGLIDLTTLFVRNRAAKQLMVLKLRGVPHITGWHGYVIGAEGLRVYPRLESVIAAEGIPAALPPPRVLTFGASAKGMDALLGGGLSSASITLMPGTAGSGKTNLCLAFLAGGVDEQGKGEPGLFVGFHETPDRLLLKADALKLHLRKAVAAGTVLLEWQPPTELLGDAMIERVLELVDRHKIERLVLDTLDDIRRATIPPERELELFVAMVTALRSRGVTTIIVQDLPRLIGGSFDLPHGGEISPVVDHIIHTRYAEIRGELRRLIVAMKLRDRAPDGAIREILFDDGIRIGDSFPEYDGILSGLPSARDGGRGRSSR
jgi:circadian clock protein KaiC